MGLKNKVLILGMNPSDSMRGLKSSTIRTLYSWLDRLELDVVSFTNIYDLPGSFTIDDVDIYYVRRITSGYTKVLALGNKVSSILTCLEIDHCKLPHPSGLNRQLNNPELVDFYLSTCKNYLYGDSK